MIADVDKVVEWLRINDIKRFKVKTANGDNNFIFKSGDAEIIENAIKRFKEVMQLSQSGRFIIEASTDENKNTNHGLFKEEFSNLTGSVAAIGATPTQVGVGYISKEEMHAEIQKALDADRIKRKLEELETENKELQKEIKESKAPVQQLIGRVSLIAAPLLENFMKARFPQVAVAGLEQEESTETDFTPVEETDTTQSEQAQRIGTALQKWSTADADFIDLLETIATMAENKDPMYTMAKNMLIKK